MSQSFLIFDFGSDEDAAQLARHRIDGWKQAFRLDKKLQLKFDRQEPEGGENADSEPAGEAEKEKSNRKAAPKRKSDAAGAEHESGSSPAGNPAISLIVRLDFSDHEKLSHHRWLERIPMEEPFKAAKPKTVRSGDAEFAKTAEYFDSLD